MTTLRLTDAGTRYAIREQGLHQRRRLARGQFAAVYEGDTPNDVYKLTADAVHFEGLRSYLIGPHFPEMTVNYGIVGEQLAPNLSLYFFKMPRLYPTRRADASTRKLCRLIREQEQIHSSDAYNRSTKEPGGRPLVHRHFLSWLGRDISKNMMENDRLPLSIREAMESIHTMACNFDNLCLDMHSGNFMVSAGGQLMFSDPIADADLL